jgi:hypothetical protein
MSETHELLGKIAALRQRLEQAHGLATEAGSAAATLLEERLQPLLWPQSLERHVGSGHELDVQLDQAVRPVTGPELSGPRALPKQLTARARRVLERGRELLHCLRPFAEGFEPEAAPEQGIGSSMGPDRDDPLGRLYRQTAALLDMALRVVPLLPESATTQLHLCEGLEAALQVVADRLATLQGGVESLRRQTARVAELAELLAGLAEGRPVEAPPFLELAEVILAEAGDGEPLRFLEGDPRRPAHFVACHGLTVARVVARVVRDDPEMRPRAADAVLAALVHDAGMLRVPAAVLSKTESLGDEEKRLIESHCRAGAEMAARLLPDAPWLADVAAGHHERLDGTGYPGGLREHQIRPLTRLLAVCDVYSAFCVNRPHRPARETRTALADTLLLAEQGLLDRDDAEQLLQLSFYPAGMAVELADGAVGVVVATPRTRRDLNAPARPVVALLTDSTGAALPLPRHLDLAHCDNHSIVRTLSTAERRAVLGRRYPEWAA